MSKDDDNTLKIENSTTDSLSRQLLAFAIFALIAWAFFAPSAVGQWLGTIYKAFFAAVL